MSPGVTRRPWLALWVCVAVGMAHALAWAAINPPFQAPDELAHAGVVDYVAQHHRPPSATGGVQATDVGDSQLSRVAQDMPFSIEGDPSFSPVQGALAQHDARSPLHVGAPPAYVSNNPPLYYALAALPSIVHSAHSAFDRLLVERLVSVLLCGLTVGLAFLFIREVLPGSPWAWTVGGLAIALQPQLGFMGGAISPDIALFASGSGLLAAVARALRLGLTPRRGLLIGLAALCGCLTKGTMYGLLPGAALGCVLSLMRERQPSTGSARVGGGATQDTRAPAPRRVIPRRATLGLAVGAGVFAAPFGAWLWVNTHVFARAASTTTAGFQITAHSRLHYVGAIASYIWQEFLPRLAFMQVQFRQYLEARIPGAPPYPAFPRYALWQIWFESFIGRFGWFEYSFPLWFEVIAASVLVAIGVCALRFVWTATCGLRRRRSELITFVTMLGGNFLLVTLVGYAFRHSTGGVSFEQGRYLFPCIALYGLIVAAACRSLAPRRGRALGAVLVVLAAGHAFAALALTLGRYYG